MPDSEEESQLISQISTHAEKHREVAKNVFGVDLDYSAESILKLDQMIREGWPNQQPALLDKVILGFGSYLGETIRKVHGGEWKYTREDGLHLSVGASAMRIWPFAKVRKRFLNGEEDSLGVYYSVIRHQLESGQIAPPVIAPPALPPPRKKTGKLALIVVSAAALVVLGFGAFLGYRMYQFVQYARAHPRQATPGEMEFKAADEKIIAGNGSGSFGNSPKAIELATQYSKSLKVLRDNFFTKGGKTTLAPLEGEFLTYCQLNSNSCVFLVHVPELRTFSDDAKKSMNDLAWMNAQAVIKSSIPHPPGTVVVGVKGLMFYDSIMIGDFVDAPQPDQDGIKTRGSGFDDVKMFYPFFAAQKSDSNTAEPMIADDSTNNSDLAIQSAKFGAGKKTVDVTARLTDLLQSEPDGFKVGAGSLQADPLPGKKKHLTVHYVYQGSNFVFSIPAGKKMSRQSLIENALKKSSKAE